MYQVANLKYETAPEASLHEFAVGDLSKMTSDFQRPLSPSQVERIIRNWDLKIFEPPTVFLLQDDTCVLGEGQHRVEAAVKKLGIDWRTTCRVVPTDRPGALFIKLSRSKRRIDQLDIFRAALADREEYAISAREVTRRYGFTVSNSGTARAIAAAGTIMDCTRTDAISLGRTLAVLDKVISNRGGETGWVKASVIRTIWFIIRNYDVDDKILARKISAKIPEAIVPFSTNEIRRNVESVFEAYNHGRRAEHRLDPSQPKYAKNWM